ncbi:12259_t:CDS:2, partial [Racocetra fulgida]
MSLKFYIIFAFILLIACSTWSAPVSEGGNGDGGLVKLDAVNGTSKRDSTPEHSGFIKMADFKDKREPSDKNLSKRELGDELSEREPADGLSEHKISKRSIIYYGVIALVIFTVHIATMPPHLI